MKYRYLMLLLLFVLSRVDAKVNVSSLWGDGMVLQRNATIYVGGSADGASVTLTASWLDKSYTVSVDEQQQWGVEIPTIDAGGPYVLTIDDGEPTVFENILLGDVWLCMGQSNMDLTLAGLSKDPEWRGEEYITQAKESQPIRLYTMAKTASAIPSKDTPGEWRLSTPESVSKFSAVGYIFGCDLQSALDIPIGLMQVAWSGSSIESWMSREWLSAVKECDLSRMDRGEMPEGAEQQSPVYLYNGMIEPLSKLAVKGGIWYQGEANIMDAEEYLELFPTFVAGLRDHLDCGEFPYYYVQIAPYDYPWAPLREGVLMREVMGKLMELTPRTGMVTTTDLGEKDDIHPPYKREVGWRLSRWALGDCYDREGFDYRAPEYDTMEVVECDEYASQAIAIKFKYAQNGLCFATQESSTLFEIAGEDRQFYPAAVKLTPEEDYQLVAWSDKVERPVAVRYAFYNYVKGDLFNSSGIAVSSFRTDDWVIE